MLADALATNFTVKGTLRPSQRIHHPSSQRISISINRVQLTSQFNECIRHHINGYHLRQHIQSKRRWTDAVWDTIDFDLFGKLFRRLDLSNQTFQMKFSHDQLALGKLSVLRSPVNDPQVSKGPCCCTETEDMSHFLRCKQNSALPNGLRAFLSDNQLLQPH